MKPLTFSKDSWHYKIASFGDTCYNRDYSNICGYTKAFFAGIFLLSLSTVAVLGLTISAGDCIGWFISGLIHGFVELSTFGVFFACIALFVTGLIAVLTVMFGIKKLNIGQKVEDSFVASAWKAHKEKWCIKVEIQ